MDKRTKIVGDLNEWANEERAYIMFSATKVNGTVFNVQVDGKGPRHAVARIFALALHRDDMLELLEEGNDWIAEHPEILKKYLNKK
jgi:hypothetical protein